MVLVSFHYYPSATAALAIAGIYAFVTVAAIVQSLRYPKARYMWTVAVMGLAEATGYALRGMVASSATPSVPLYVNSQLFLLLAPIALACDGPPRWLPTAAPHCAHVSRDRSYGALVRYGVACTVGRRTASVTRAYHPSHPPFSRPPHIDVCHPEHGRGASGDIWDGRKQDGA